MADADRFGELSSKIEAVAESLTELGMEVLREALESVYSFEQGGTDPDDPANAVVAAARNKERILNRARASLEKAVALLRRLEADEVGATDWLVESEDPTSAG